MNSEPDFLPFPVRHVTTPPIRCSSPSIGGSPPYKERGSDGHGSRIAYHSGNNNNTSTTNNNDNNGSNVPSFFVTPVSSDPNGPRLPQCRPSSHRNGEPSNGRFSGTLGTVHAATTTTTNSTNHHIPAGTNHWTQMLVPTSSTERIQESYSGPLHDGTKPERRQARHHPPARHFHQEEPLEEAEDHPRRPSGAKKVPEARRGNLPSSSTTPNMESSIEKQTMTHSRSTSRDLTMESGNQAKRGTPCLHSATHLTDTINRSNSNLLSSEMHTPVPQDSSLTTSSISFRPVPKVFTDFWEETNAGMLSPLAPTTSRSTHTTPHVSRLASFSQLGDHHPMRNTRKGERPSEVHDEWEELIVGSKDPDAQHSASKRSQSQSASGKGHRLQLGRPSQCSPNENDITAGAPMIDREASLSQSFPVKLPALECSAGGLHHHAHSGSISNKDNYAGPQSSAHALHQGANYLMSSNCSLFSRTAGSTLPLSRHTSMMVENSSALSGFENGGTHAGMSVSASHLGSQHAGEGTTATHSGGGIGLPRCTPPPPATTTAASATLRQGSMTHTRQSSFGFGSPNVAPSTTRDRLSPILHPDPHLADLKRNSEQLDLPPSLFSAQHPRSATTVWEPVHPKMKEDAGGVPQPVWPSTFSSRNITPQHSAELLQSEEDDVGASKRHGSLPAAGEAGYKKKDVGGWAKENRNPSTLLPSSPPPSGEAPQHASPRNKYDSLRLAFRSTKVVQDRAEAKMSGSLLSGDAGVDEDDSAERISPCMLNWLMEQKKLMETGELGMTDTVGSEDSAISVGSRLPSASKKSVSPDPPLPQPQDGSANASSAAAQAASSLSLQAISSRSSPSSSRGKNGEGNPREKLLEKSLSRSTLKGDYGGKPSHVEVPVALGTTGRAVSATRPSSSSAKDSTSRFPRRTSADTPPLPDFQDQQLLGDSYSNCPSMHQTSLTNLHDKSGSDPRLQYRSGGSSPHSKGKKNQDNHKKNSSKAAVATHSSTPSPGRSAHRASFTMDVLQVDASDSLSQNKSLHLHPVCKKNTVPYGGQAGCGNSSLVHSDSSVSLREDCYNSPKCRNSPHGHSSSTKHSTPFKSKNKRGEDGACGVIGNKSKLTIHENSNRSARSSHSGHDASPISLGTSSASPHEHHAVMAMFSDGAEAIPLPNANRTLPFYPRTTQQALDYLNNF